MLAWQATAGHRQFLFVKTRKPFDLRFLQKAGMAWAI
jgi:hypothetical protein